MKKLLIVVDYQTDFVTGPLGFPEALALEKPLAARIEERRRAGYDIVFTYDTHEENYMETREGRMLPVPHCVKGTEGWEFYGDVAASIREGDKVFYKPVFGSAELFDYLRDSDYDSVELTGIVADICVVSNTILARTALPEAEIVVDAAYIASPDPEKKEAALSVMESTHVKVIGR